jgi:hypothetical protein
MPHSLGGISQQLLPQLGKGKLTCLSRSGSWMGMNIAHYPEDRKGRCNFLEFRQWGILAHGYMGPRSRCVLQVRPQDGGALLGGNLFEVDLLTPAAAEHSSSTGCSHVLDPIHVLSKHRHQVPLCIDDGHHHWQRDGAPGLSSGHFQCHDRVGRDARGGNSSPRSIGYLRDPVGSLPPVQPSLAPVQPVLEVATSHLSLIPLSCTVYRSLRKSYNTPITSASRWSALVSQAQHRLLVVVDCMQATLV